MHICSSSLMVAPVLAVVSLVSACGVDTSIPRASTPISPSSTPRTVINKTDLEPDAPTLNSEVPAAGSSQSQPAVAVDPSIMKVKVTGFKTLDGQLCYSLFDSANREFFGREDAPRASVLRAACVPISGEETLLSIRELPKGSFAIALFHDKNSNSVLDKNGIIPAERFGFSNNPAIRFGAPSFDDCAFLFDGVSYELIIGLKYLLDL